jgi:hypothetical protein
MRVKGQQTLAVIQCDEVALEIKWPRQQHRTVFMAATGVPLGTRKSRPRRGLEVLPLKIRSEPKTSEISASAGGELSRPLAVRRDPAQIVLFDLLTFFNFFLLLGGGLGELAFNVELYLDLGIFTLGDGEFATERTFLPGVLPG